MNNINSLTMNDIREYLLDSNAIEEAESILLHNILNRSHQAIKEKVIKDHLYQDIESNLFTISSNNSINKKDTHKEIDNLKIYDLLGSYENEIKMIEKDKYDKNQKEFLKIKGNEDNYEKVKLINDITKNELLNLEIKRDFLHDKHIKNKQELDKLNIIYNQNQSNGIINSDLSYVSKHMNKPLSNQIITNIKDFQELNEQHSRRIIQNKTETLTYKKELELINKGKWNLDASYLRNPSALSENSKNIPSVKNRCNNNNNNNINSSKNNQNNDMNNANNMNNDDENNNQSVLDINMQSENNRLVDLLASKNQLDSIISDISSDNIEFNNNIYNNHNDLSISSINDCDDTNDSDNDKSLTSSNRIDALLKSLQADQLTNNNSNTITEQYQYINQLKQQAIQEKANLHEDVVFNDLTNYMIKDQQQQKLFNYGSVSTYYDQVSSSPRPLKTNRIIDKNVRVSDFLDNWLNKAEPQPVITTTNNMDRRKVDNNLNNRDSNKNQLESKNNYNRNDSDRNVYSTNRNNTATAANKVDTDSYKLKRDNNLSPRITPQQQQQPQQQAGLNVLNQFRNLPVQQQYPIMPQQEQQHQILPFNSMDSNLSLYNNPQLLMPSGAGMVHPSSVYNPYYPVPTTGIGVGDGQSLGGAGMLSNFPAPMSVMNPYYIQQQYELMQVQKLSERLEQENMKLIQQLEQPSNKNNIISNDNNLDQRHMNDYDRLYPLERDRRNGYMNKESLDKAGGGGALSIRENRHNEEIKRIQNEIERLKYQKELDEVQSEYSKQKKVRDKELEQEQWLDQSKQELQKLKLQQVLEKEQKLLKLQREENSNGYNNENEYNLLNPSQIKQLKIESGVGLSPISFDLVSGISIIVDGVILPENILISGSLFRIALGIYDKSGKTIQRLNASEWQEYKLNKNGDKDNLQALNALVMHSFKIKGITKDDILTNRALLEVQTKQREDTTIQKSIGWVVSSFITQIINNPNNYNNNDNEEVHVLNNNAWRTVLRKGITDPAISITEIIASPLNFIPETWILFRIIETNELNNATAWTLSSSSILKTDKHALSFYTDVYNPNQPQQQQLPPTERNLSIANKDRNMNKHPISSRSSTHSRENEPMSIRGPNNDNDSNNDNYIFSTKPNNAINVIKAVNRFAKGKHLSKLEESDDHIDHDDDKSNENNEDGEIKSLPSQHSIDEPEHHMLLQDTDVSSYWFLGTPSGPCTCRYQRGDGIDVYIDSCMSLPDNCTVSRVVMRVFSSEKEQFGGVYEEYSFPGSVSTSPMFNLKAEIRGPSFNTTMIAIIRIDTMCSVTMLPSTVGYVICKIFATKDRNSITIPSDNSAYINTGSFQLPIYGGRLNPNITEFNEKMINDMPKIPCASLLIRIITAPKSKDDITTLSRNEFASDEWKHLGLDVPASSYSSGAYDGSSCEPTEKEFICFRIKKQYNVPESVESALLQAMAVIGSPNIENKPSGNSSIEMLEWFRKLFPPHATMKRSIDYAFTVPYAVESGLLLSVDGLYNMPDNGLFSTKSTIYKVITSTSPPGVFYKTPPIFDQVYYTKTHDVDAHWRAPQYNDGYYLFNPPIMSDNLYIILDIRTIHVESNGVINIEPPSQRKSYWSLLPLSMEKIPEQGYLYAQSGIYHLPIFEGPVPNEDLFKTSNPYNELKLRLGFKSKDKNSIKVVDGAMIMIKVLNPLIEELVIKTEFQIIKPFIQKLFMNSLLDVAIQGSSQNNAKKDKFNYDIFKYPSIQQDPAIKSTGSQLPKLNTDVHVFIRNINKAFELKTGIGMQI